MPQPDRHTESAILSLLSRGDAIAFKVVYTSYSPTLFNALMAYTEDTHTAQDILQSVFVDVWEKREQLYTINNFSNYLFILARNRIFDHFKTKAYQSTLLTYWTSEYDVIDTEPNITLALEEKEFQELIQEAIAQLPIRQREVYKLYANGEQTYEEIAQQLHLSKLTIKKHLELARRSVRQYVRVHIPDLALLPVLFWFS